MKSLVIQISDMHCKSGDEKLSCKIDKVVRALKSSFSGIGKIILIVSGDLTDKALVNEFKSARSIIGKLLFELSDQFKCGFINTYIVPGNHDINLSYDYRGSAEIISWGDKNAHIYQEIDRLKSFYQYSQSKGCFNSDKICDVQILQEGDQKFQICMLNSAPFSTLSPDDKELHFMPSYVRAKLKRDPTIDIKISIMHHSFEWCEWNTKEMLKSSFSTDDIVFFGHDHKAESIVINNANGSLNIIMGGKFPLANGVECSFNTVFIDSSLDEMDRYEFNWHIEQEIFIKTYRGTIKKKKKELIPADDFVNKLLKDTQNISDWFTDYYVLPKFTANGDVFSDKSQEINIDKIFNVLKSEKVLRITGGHYYGKTSLLRYLYYKSISKGFLPLLIEKRDYHDGRIDKMFRDMFELQYGSNCQAKYELFLQSDINTRIIFLDDLDLIQNEKARGNLFSFIVEKGGLLVYSVREKNLSIETIVKNKIEGKSISSLEIRPFYKSNRDELVKNVCKIYGNEANENSIVNALDYMVQYQAGLFSHTPSNLLQYIKYFLNNNASTEKGIKTVTLIFETNIRGTMISNANAKDVTIYLALLEMIADFMYFTVKREKISIPELENVVSTFNVKRKATVNLKHFLTTCQKAKILIECDDSYDFCFVDKNTIAYFVAKYINRMLEKNPANLEKVSYVMNHICFGINDEIILFLSYIRSNARIILNIAFEAKNLLEKYPEWDFDKNNIPFLSQQLSLPEEAPRPKDKIIAVNKTEEVEKAKHEAVRFRGIFDFQEEDAEKESYRILRALKYAQLIGRALVDQYGDLESDEIESMTKAIFTTSQKIIYAILQPYQEHYEQIINNILTFAKEKAPEKKITESDVKKILGQAGIILTLNIMNDIAYNSSDSNTIFALREVTPLTTNYKVFELIMEENTGNSTEFVTRAIKLRSQCDKNEFANKLITQIARKHVIYSKEIDHRLVNKLVSGKVFSADSKKNLLLAQGKNKES